MNALIKSIPIIHSLQYWFEERWLQGGGNWIRGHFRKAIECQIRLFKIYAIIEKQYIF